MLRPGVQAERIAERAGLGHPGVVAYADHHIEALARAGAALPKRSELQPTASSGENLTGHLGTGRRGSRPRAARIRRGRGRSLHTGAGAASNRSAPSRPRGPCSAAVRACVAGATRPAQAAAGSGSRDIYQAGRGHLGQAGGDRARDPRSRRPPPDTRTGQPTQPPPPPPEVPDLHTRSPGRHQSRDRGQAIPEPQDDQAHLGHIFAKLRVRPCTELARLDHPEQARRDLKESGCSRTLTESQLGAISGAAAACHCHTL